MQFGVRSMCKLMNARFIRSYFIYILTISFMCQATQCNVDARGLTIELRKCIAGMFVAWPGLSLPFNSVLPIYIQVNMIYILQHSFTFDIMQFAAVLFK